MHPRIIQHKRFSAKQQPNGQKTHNKTNSHMKNIADKPHTPTETITKIPIAGRYATIANFKRIITKQ